MTRMKMAFKDNPRSALAFILAACIALVFTIRLMFDVFFWHPEGPRPLQPWMTIGIVGRMHDLDPREIDRIAGFPTPDHHGRPPTLADIAEMRGVPIEQIIEEAEAAIRDLSSEASE